MKYKAMKSLRMMSVAFLVGLSGYVMFQNEKDAKKMVILQDVQHSTGAYKMGEEIHLSATIINTSAVENEIWVEYRILNYEQELVHQVVEKRILNGTDTVLHDLSILLDGSFSAGNYTTVLNIYDNNTTESNDELLASNKSEKSFQVFSFQEEFNKLDTSIWNVSNKKLGRTTFRDTNVFVDQSLLAIEMSAHSFLGGELYSKQLHNYGIYEIRMKLPLAPTSITGFFLYKSPDYEFEIDIELYNDSSGTLLLTTYANGKNSNEYKGSTKFDPTAEFHNYRIEYQKEYVAFYIDNELMLEWKEGIPEGEMYLMLNSWYPNWLEGTQVKHDEFLQVEWIRY